MVECPECEGSKIHLKPTAKDDGHQWRDEDFEECPECKGVGEVTPEQAREIRKRQGL